MLKMRRKKKRTKKTTTVLAKRQESVASWFDATAESARVSLVPQLLWIPLHLEKRVNDV